ncbi:hypothetical protein [Stieleria varia]|uniref:Cadherin domain-containing protein n=1 Tax=Stieleria varia TaxID=2528005 RepID=A0A5C6B8R5_9BACT|nr:hypothetical protein [Stieleria varia]TWU07689.1 hypothetical protein Pla52n_02620 [Stieleria varia]
MTQRERILLIAVGSLLVLGAGQWGWSKYKDAIDYRQGQIESLTNSSITLEETVLQGALADGRMGEYLTRSLPSDKVRAASDYQNWLRDVIKANGIRNPSVDPTTTMSGALYHKLGFRISGEAPLPNVLKLLHDFYSKDYLHRISDLDLRPSKIGGFTLKMSVDALALTAAAEDAAEPTSESWHITNDVAHYSEPILNRNLFEPPNQSPQYTGNQKVEAIVGRRTPITLTFKDPESHRVDLELIGEPDPRVTLDSRSGTLQVDSKEKGEIQVRVRATDSGYPHQSVEQTLSVAVVDPPPPPEPPVTPPAFDDATQTFLTALVQGDEDWVAWMNVRTKGKTLKLRVGDGFEIGTVKGTVTAITANDVEIEVGDRKFKLTPDGALKDAAKAAMED